MTGRFRIIPLSDIAVGERLRPVDEDHAKVLAHSIEQIGLMNPITVRLTPAAKGGTYTLVAGAHRLRAFELLKRPDIEALVIKAKGADAELAEIHENFSRNDLSALERARFVARLRELWEETHGEPINPKGGRRRNSAKLAELFGDGISDFVAKRLGVSKRVAERLHQIAANLHPELRDVFRGTPIADNQSALVKCAKLEPAKQRMLAEAFRLENGDFARALKHVEPEKGRQDEKARLMNMVFDAWTHRLNEAERQELMGRLGLMRRPIDEWPAPDPRDEDRI